MFTRTLLRKVLPLFLVLFLLGNAVYSLRHVGVTEGYAPEQPIPFSHKKHAGLYQIPCMYCHANADKSKHATVPSLNICMNCHSVVDTNPPSPWLNQIREHYKNNQPIKWVKVHDMPDFVNFNHKRHIAKGVSCETCHGDVKNMDRISQAMPMTMGWCLDCHRGKTTPENLYNNNNITGYSAFDDGLGHTKEGMLQAVDGDESKLPPQSHAPGSAVAPTSCWTCHH